MTLKNTKISGRVKKHFPITLVIGSILVLSLYFAHLYTISNQKITDLQANIAELSLVLSKTTSNIQASTSESLASAINALPKPTVITPTKTQDELIRLAISKVSESVTSINVLKNTSLAELSSVNGNTIQTNSEKSGEGSGIIVRSDGYIVTNNHVVSDQDANYSVTLSDGTEEIAKVIYRNPDFDIAIIKIADKKYVAAKLGNSDNIQVGDTVEAIGNALGEYGNSVSVGIVSGLHRVIESSNGAQKIKLSDAIQTDAAINPGNSGGPLVDINGNVIGINVATVVGSSNISFAIPINVIKSIIAEVI